MAENAGTAPASGSQEDSAWITKLESADDGKRKTTVKPDANTQSSGSFESSEKSDSSVLHPRSQESDYQRSEPSQGDMSFSQQSVQTCTSSFMSATGRLSLGADSIPTSRRPVVQDQAMMPPKEKSKRRIENTEYKPAKRTKTASTLPSSNSLQKRPSQLVAKPMIHSSQSTSSSGSMPLRDITNASGRRNSLARGPSRPFPNCSLEKAKPHFNESQRSASSTISGSSTCTTSAATIAKDAYASGQNNLSALPTTNPGPGEYFSNHGQSVAAPKTKSALHPSKTTQTTVPVSRASTASRATDAAHTSSHPSAQQGCTNTSRTGQWPLLRNYIFIPASINTSLVIGILKLYRAVYTTSLVSFSQPCQISTRPLGTGPSNPSLNRIVLVDSHDPEKTAEIIEQVLAVHGSIRETVTFYDWRVLSSISDDASLSRNPDATSSLARPRDTKHQHSSMCKRCCVPHDNIHGYEDAHGDWKVYFSGRIIWDQTHEQSVMVWEDD